tara:strand:- start:242 stop:883 length:642 start_codon:yes stop_codon:yes gene_type:complete
MLNKINLYGKLAEITGYTTLEAQVDSLPSVISFLIHNFPKCEAYIAANYFRIDVGDENITEDQIHDPIGSREITIIPQIAGAGDGFMNFVFGGLLIFSSFFFPGAGLFGTTSFLGSSAAVVGISTQGALTATAIGTGLSAIGAAMVFNGISSLFAPTLPDFADESNPTLGSSFNQIQNTARAGVPVPIIYGEIFTGSIIISATVDTVQIIATA